MDDRGRTWMADDGTYVGTGNFFSVDSTVPISDTTNPTVRMTNSLHVLASSLPEKKSHCPRYFSYTERNDMGHSRTVC